MIKLFDYQKKDIEWLATKRQAFLGHEMGLGKTAILIKAAQKIRAHKILIVCPAVGKYNWQNEYRKFGSEYADVLEVDKPLKFAKNICSYEFAKKHLHKLNKTKWDLLIVDEAHYLKEPTSQRAKIILGNIRNRGLIHNAGRSWFASGTPCPNHAGELWVFLFTFGLTKISYDGFVARYCNSHRDGNHYARIQITGSNTKHTPELKNIFKGQYIRRLAEDELNLPPLVHNPYYIKGDDDSSILQIFPDLKDKIKEELELLKENIDFNPDVSDHKLLSALMLMSRSIMSLRRYHGLRKVKPVAELITQELLSQEYKKIIVFGIHKDVLKYLKQSLMQFKPLLITGDTPAMERQRIVDRFQTDESVGVLIGNIHAAGTAITLTAANQVLFIEQDWVPGNNAQAAKRAHRIGQTLPVFVRHIAIKNSIDEKITAALTRKIKEISTFI